MSITGIGLLLVFVSNILMIAVQTMRLEVSPIDTIQTSFGTMWIIRMVITYNEALTRIMGFYG